MTSIVPQDTVLEDSCPSLGFLSLTGWVPAQRYQPLGPSLFTDWGRFFTSEGASVLREQSVELVGNLALVAVAAMLSRLLMTAHIPPPRYLKLQATP